MATRLAGIDETPGQIGFLQSANRFQGCRAIAIFRAFSLGQHPHAVTAGLTGILIGDPVLAANRIFHLGTGAGALTTADLASPLIVSITAIRAVKVADEIQPASIAAFPGIEHGHTRAMGIAGVGVGVPIFSADRRIYRRVAGTGGGGWAAFTYFTTIGVSLEAVIAIYCA